MHYHAELVDYCPHEVVGSAVRSGPSTPERGAQVFEGCGHCLFLEAPEEFNRAVETFVHRVTSD